MFNILFGIAVIFAQSSQAMLMPVSEQVQASILQFYAQDNCVEARKLMAHYDLTNLRPNVMAVAAYCEPIGYDPESLFARAESLNQTGDLILVLHAKYRTKKDPKSAVSIWERVLMVARNSFFRDLAKERLAGVLVDDAKEKPLNLSPSTGIGYFYFSGFSKRNPEQAELAFLDPKRSYGLALGGTAAYRHWYEFGSLGVRYTLNYENFGRSSEYNFLNSNLDVPIAFNLVTSKDLIFRPFLGYSDLGGKPYHFTYGMGMKAAVYAGDHVQSVQGIFYTDRIYHSAITPAQGSHYRFEFAWDFFPLYWTINTLFAVEHVSSTGIASFLGSSGFFEMSHNDLAMEFRFERQFSHFSVELAPKLKYRADTDDSTYNNREGALTAKQREDIGLDLKTTVSVPLITSLQIFGWYEWNNIYSNFGAADFANFNYHNHTFGVGLRTSVSTY